MNAGRLDGRKTAACVAVLGLVVLGFLVRGLLQDPAAPPGLAPAEAHTDAMPRPDDAAADARAKAADGASESRGVVVARRFDERRGSGRGVIRGRVVDAATDLPIAGARVLIAPHEDESASPPEAVETGRDGAFETVGVALRIRQVQVHADGYRTQVLNVLLSARRREATLRVRLAAGPRAFGRVVDEAGRPVAGAAIKQRPAWSGAEAVLSGADGVFAAPHQHEAGEALFDVDHADFAPAAAFLAEGVVVVLRRARRPWTGKVVDEDDRPIAGATVVATSREATDAVAAGRRAATLTTGADGAFSWAEPAPGPLSAVVAAPGFVPEERGAFGDDPSRSLEVPLAPDAPVVAAKFVLRRGVVVRGSVAYADDRAPAVGATVELHPKTFGPGVPVVVDAAGRFVATVPPAAAWDALVRPPAAEGADAQQFEVAAAEAAGEVRLVVRRTPLLRGVVVDARDERPVAGAMIVVWDGWMWGPGGFSAADGTFSFRRPTRDVELQTTASGYLPGALPFKVADQDPFVTIRLSPAGVLTGFVTDAEGAADPRIVVIADRLDGGDGRRVEILPDATGYFELGDRAAAEAGRWRLSPALASPVSSSAGPASAEDLVINPMPDVASPPSAEWFVAGDAVEMTLGPGVVAEPRLIHRGVGMLVLGRPEDARGADDVIYALGRGDGGVLALAARGAAADVRVYGAAAAATGATITAPAGTYRVIGRRGDGRESTRVFDLTPGATVDARFEP